MSFRTSLVFFGFLVTSLVGGVTARAQQMAAESNGCGLDFLPIGSHQGLPEGAMYTRVSASAEDRAADVVHRLTFDEKLGLTGGYKAFFFPGATRLGIPPVYFTDATQGIHEKNLCADPQRTTAFPSGQALAATWNVDLASRYAAAISEECRAWGISVLLGPGLNLYRNSEGGRNFEYFGEDPFLAARMGVGYIRGMQGMGTVATVKHFLGNEQEFVRHVADVEIGQRALHEIYLPPFEAAIKQGGVLAVMTGNNMVNGHPGAADTPLSQGVLRDEYGFKGPIMSDWANSMYWRGRESEELESGHSLLMADNSLFADWVNGEVSAHPEKKPMIEAALGRMAQENLYSFFKMGIYDRPQREVGLLAKIDSHQEIARQVAEESITLLKNEGGILPLEPVKTKSLAVVGTDEALTVYGGRGSGAVKGYNHVDFLAGLQAAYGDKVKRLADTDEAGIRSAAVVLYFISKPAGENFDVPYDVPGLAESVERLAALNPNIVVVVSGGNGLPMPWLPKVKAVLFAYLLGQQRGVALADILSGKANPSGKLPFTIERSFRDSPAYDYNKLPDGTLSFGGSRGDSLKAQKKFNVVPIKYSEGVYIGYRWFEKKKITPVFPFGYGLSYTTFQYSTIKASSSAFQDTGDVQVSFTITNSGHRDGAETAQVYVHPLTGGDRPIKELKGFEKVQLRAGESKAVTMSLSRNDLRYWDETSKDWKVDHGDYEVLVGSSSADIRGKVTVRY